MLLWRLAQILNQYKGITGIPPFLRENKRFYRRPVGMMGMERHEKQGDFEIALL